MSKLVKLTSAENLVKSDNSFKCQCDDDIIIPPNSKVSLINAHISSGILSNYNINDTFTIGSDTGAKIGELYLTTDNSDRLREIMIENNNYQMNSLLLNMTKQFNKSLMFTSSSSTKSATSNSFNLPAEYDFNLGILCNLDQDKKVNIKYAGAPQLYTADLSYKNVSSGINIDPNGIISYTGAINIPTLNLDKTIADTANRKVFSTLTDQANDFINQTSVTLQDTTGVGAPLNAIISTYNDEHLNTDSSVTIDPTKVNLATSTVQSTNLNFVNTLNVGDNVCMDDGAGILGTPSANQITGTIQTISQKYVNENHEVDDLNPLLTTLNTYNSNIPVVGIKDKGSDIYELIFDITLADSLNYHIINDAIFHTIDDKNVIQNFFKITDVKQNKKSASRITVTAQFYNSPNPINPVFKSVNTFEYFKTSKNTVADQADLQLDDALDNLLLLYAVRVSDNKKFEICTFQSTISYDNTNELINVEMLPANKQFDNGTTLDADPLSVYNQIYNFFDDKDYQIYLTSFTRVITTNETLLTNFGIVNNDAGIIESNAIYDGLQYGSPVQFTDSAGKNYVIVPVKSIKFADAYDDYLNIKNVFFSITNSSGILFKNDNSQCVSITLSNLNPLTVSLGVITRLWEGTNISLTRSYTLLWNQRNIDLKNYDLMIKGSGQSNSNLAFALEDNRINHGCGRVAFLVNTIGKCRIGLIKETSFNNMNPINADYSICIEGSVGNYYYTIRKNGVVKPLKTNLEALQGDRIVIQYGVSPSTSDFEYKDNINSGTNAGVITNNDCFASVGAIDESDRGKILVSILRTTEQNNYIYLGSVLQNGVGTNVARTRCIPWTPRNNPYIAPDYIDNSTDYHVFVNPNEAQISVLELSPDPTITTVNGVSKEIEPQYTSLYYDDSLHTHSNTEVASDVSRFTAFNNAFDFTFTDIYLQKQLGFKESTNPMTGQSKTWIADINYLSSYLPENVVILLDNMSNIQTYDCNKNNGGRRNIICVAVNTQDKLGEINIEPQNLYRVSLENKEPINLKKFSVSFENFYGEQIQLQSARAVVNLLFES